MVVMFVTKENIYPHSQCRGFDYIILEKNCPPLSEGWEKDPMYHCQQVFASPPSWLPFLEGLKLLQNTFSRSQTIRSPLWCRLIDVLHSSCSRIECLNSFVNLIVGVSHLLILGPF